MSSKVNEKNTSAIEQDLNNDRSEEPFQLVLFRIVKSYSEVLRISSRPDIYTGEETIPFQERHPIFKAFMKLEFKDAIE